MNMIPLKELSADELALIEGGIAPVVVGAVAVLSGTSFLYGIATGLVIRYMLR